MWTLLITIPLVLLTGILFYFLLRRNQKNDPPLILQKYPLLLRRLKENSSVQNERYGSRSVTFRKSKGDDTWTYFISEVDDRLIVAWKLDSKTYGSRGKEWSFNSIYDQDKMFEEISADLRQYSRQMYK